MLLTSYLQKAETEMVSFCASPALVCTLSKHKYDRTYLCAHLIKSMMSEKTKHVICKWFILLVFGMASFLCLILYHNLDFLFKIEDAPKQNSN